MNTLMVQAQTYGFIQSILEERSSEENPFVFVSNILSFRSVSFHRSVIERSDGRIDSVLIDDRGYRDLDTLR